MRVCHEKRPLGIIPARAGFTREAIIRRGRRPDHPRSRGVYAVVADRTVVVKGSSPLARGLRLNSLLQARQPRIIPARAGFT